MQITIDGLSADSLEAAAKKVRRMQKQYADKNKEFVRQLTKTGIDEASQHLEFQGDAIQPTLATHNPHVMTGSNGEMTAKVRLTGEDVVFVEFGAGVFYNGEVGGSPHPKGVELGYTIGGYGLGQGANESWTYTDKAGNKIETKGTQAAMPLAHASERVRQEYKDIAQTIFRS